MTTTPNPIDSLPPTDERVGMPSNGDTATCDACDGFSMFFQVEDGSVECVRCDGYDITGHGVASLKGVRE